MLSTLIKTLIIFLVFIAGIYLYISWQTATVTDIGKYKTIITERWLNTMLIEHFPKEIPNEATNTKLYYQPGFAQGGSTLELMITAPKPFVENLAAKYAPVAKAQLPHAGDSDQHNEETATLPKKTFYTADTSPAESGSLSPAGFTTYLISSKPYKTDPVSWNHGTANGISINSEQGQVIYWAKSW